MKQKLLSVLLSVVLVLIAIAPAFTVANAAVWTGSVSVPSISGGVYQIATGENLAWFSNAVNSGNNSIKGKLTADIQLNAEGSTANRWTPIGTDSCPFMGEFDGDGYVISGLYVNSELIGAGLFGYVAYTESEEAPEDVSAEYIIGTKEYYIKNISLTDSYVRATQNVGGIVGHASNAGILNCSYSGTVIANGNSIGGIVGWGTSETVISECRSSGSVTGNLRVGGTVGYLNGNSIAVKCYGDASVTGSQNVGGIVGTLSSSSMIGAFFLGTITANDRAGGLVGYSAFGSMTTGYTISSVTNTGTNTVDFGGAVGVIYGGEYSSIFYCYETSGVDGPKGLGRTRAEMKGSDFIKELNRTSPYFCFDYTNINNGYPVLTWMLQLDVWAGDRTMPRTNSAGTYLISKPSELAWFAALVNGELNGMDANPSANALVTDNLLFNIDVNDDSMGLREWTPIGTAQNPYSGTFDADGYNIASIYTDPETLGDNADNVGLFGYVSGGSITDVVLLGSLIRGRENVGGIVGYMLAGTVVNCLCDSEIQGDRAVGGIVGNIGSSSTVSTCGMTGTVTGTKIGGDTGSLQNVGGIVGYNNRSTVTKCFASAHINAPLARWAGGIIGNNVGGNLTASYSTSTVVGGVNAGGIMGCYNNGTVEGCYTAGKVTGTMQAGIGFGTMSGSGVSSCYYDSSFITASNTELGVTAKTSTEMTGSNSTINLSLGSSFSATADDLYFYYYPQISVMTYSPIDALCQASIESVKRVQGKYIAKVEIDGRTDTYYETLENAFNYAANTASSVLPTVFLVRDYELTQTLNINSTVGFYGENEAILTRSDSLTDAMINVTGELTIGSDLYGDDEEPQFFIDGNNIQGTQSAIVVNNGAKLIVSEGVVVENCITASTSVRGAAVNVVKGSFEMKGGLFTANKSKTVAGAVYGEESTINVTGGTFYLNESRSQGGAIYNNNGTSVIKGGEFNGNIANTYGGAVAGYGVYSSTVISGNANFTQNAATFGGALSVQNYGTLEIDGGTISENRGYSQGGALYIESGAEAVISGGTISDNTVYNATNPAYGSGVYNNGTLALKGSGQVDSSNDIYLPTGKYITVDERLTCSGYAATITPQAYVEGTKVLDGNQMSSFYSKIGVTNTMWHILASGKLTNIASTSVAILSKNLSYSVEYVSLADAFAAVGDNDTANITVTANTTVTESIPVHGDVTLTCDDNTYTVMRSGAFAGIMFDVQPGAVLRIGDETVNSDQQAQSDYLSNTVTAGQIVIDGGYRNTGIIGASAVNVQAGGTLYLNDDAIIQNCNNPGTSAVNVSGTMHMYGGTISDNISTYGGGIYVTVTGTLNTYGGVIAGNTSKNEGSAIYSLGRVIRNIQSYDFFYIENLYDEEGKYIGSADPEYKVSLKTDIMIGEGETVYLNTNMITVSESQSTVYSYSYIPESTDFAINSMIIELSKYTSGNTVVTGTNVSSYYTGFIPYADGYYILSTGKLGLNKIVPKSSSTLSVDRSKNIITGIIFGQNTVTTLGGKFENERATLKFYSADGKLLKTSNTITTGCVIKLINTTTNEVIDTVTVVVYGDVNADEAIDGRDALFIRAIAGGMLTQDDIGMAAVEAADVNADGNVTAIDADSVEACAVYLLEIEQTR